ncbi:MAG: hypothetical protein Q9227_004250 [Pyrenula ochraceoflavens]
MDGYIDPSDHPKSKRRRVQIKKPISAHLVFDDSLSSDAVEIADDFWTDLFTSHIRDAAPGEGRSTIRVSPNFPAINSFRKTFESFEPSRNILSINKPIEIYIQDVVPLYLDVVYLAVEKDLLEKVDETQRKFAGGYNASNARRQKHSSIEKVPITSIDRKEREAETHNRLIAAMRDALHSFDVIHSGDLLPLPLPSHPITHVPTPPALITACEPVDQGRLSAKTRIILVQSRSSQDRIARKAQPSQPLMNDVLEDTEDTSNEQFYSAAEDKPDESTSELDSGQGEESSERSGSSSDEGDASDDSLEDMISLAAPGLPQQPAGIMSAASAATPRAGMRKGTGVHTPGSMYSSFTNATSRPGRAAGKVFRAQPLSRRVPTEVLYPKPREEEDEDVFVFVDTSVLARIGCFSGDWVKVEVSAEPSIHGLSSLGIGTVNGHQTENADWRPARVFGLPGLGTARPRYTLDKSGDRRSSFSHGLQPPLSPILHLSPILLLNMENPKFVKVSPLLPNQPHNARSPQEPMRLTSPPPAEQVTLLKLRTTLALERTADSITFSGLKHHFESKHRILKRGDLIGIPVNKEIAKTTYSPGRPAEEASESEFAYGLSRMVSAGSEDVGIVWFYVSQITAAQSLDAVDDRYDEETWNGALVNYTSTTRMNANSAESGHKARRIPSETSPGLKQWFINHAFQASNFSLPLQAPSQVFRSPLHYRLCDLITAAISPRAVAFHLPALFILIYSNQRQTGKSYIAKAACIDANVEPFNIDCFDLISEGVEGNSGEYRVEETLLQRADRVLSCGAESTVLILQHIEILTAERISPALEEILGKSRVVIATSTDSDKIPDSIRGQFTHEMELSAPDELEREGILRNAVKDRGMALDPSVDLNSVALKTAALVAGDLVDVVSRASHARQIRLEQLAQTQTALLSFTAEQPTVTVRDILVSGGPTAHFVLPSDFDAAITHARTAFSASIGAPKIPSVTWSDVGGLSSVKSSVMETISLPLERPELFARGMRKRSGILFYGPPGTGKTLLAKAIATEFSLNFFSVKGPELLNKYIGESEANVRRVFQRARDARPCVVFFDELDSVAPKRGNQGDSGGVMDRIVSQLLAELDGMSSGTSTSSADKDDKSSANAGGVFVIGATNRPDLLDPALLRPGRFDKMVYLGVPDSHEKQVPILEALTRKFTLAPEIALQRVAAKLPLTYTGADLYALCSDAMLKAVMRRAKSVDMKVRKLEQERGESISTAYFFDRLAQDEDTRVVVGEEDFEMAQGELVASVR